MEVLGEDFIVSIFHLKMRIFTHMEGHFVEWYDLYASYHSMLYSTLFWQLLQSTWFQTYWYYHSSGSHQLDWEGDSVIWATQSPHRYSEASTLERTLQLCSYIGPTWGMTVTGYKPKLHWHIAGCQGHSWWWERLFHLTGQLPPALSWAALSQ